MSVTLDPKWLGRVWKEGQYECADLAREFMAERFGVAVPWGKPASGVRAKDAQFRDVVGGGLVKRITGQPVNGDLVLMREHPGRRLAGWHVGVWFGGRVLHLPADGVSMHETTNWLSRRWLIEGYYRCR